MFATYFVDGVKMLHVPDVDVNPAYVCHGAAGFLDGRFQVFTSLACLGLGIADPGHGPGRRVRRHAGYENQLAAGGHGGGVRKMSTRRFHSG